MWQLQLSYFMTRYCCFWMRSVAPQLDTVSWLLWLSFCWYVVQPTSGLDSFQALNVMMHLSDSAALQGRMVVCSIHQPRSAIYQKLDHLIILSQGLARSIICASEQLSVQALCVFKGRGASVITSFRVKAFY